MSRMAVFAAALLAAFASAAEGERSSDDAFVFLKPEELSFWHTATNSSFMVPVLFPRGAASATLTVTGAGYSSTTPGITPESLDAHGEYPVTLPPAAGPEAENVYSLALEFDDGTVRTARLGVISGLEPGGSGVTRCIAPKDGGKWSVGGSRAVVPVPYGTTSLSVGGEPVDTGLGGEQGWYCMSLPAVGQQLALSLETDADVYETVLVGKGVGVILIFR